MHRLGIRTASVALLVGLVGGSLAHAQEPALLTAKQATQMVAGPYFLIAIIVGLVLAVGFQLLLTNLSIAAGVSAFRIGAETREEEPRRGKRVSFAQRARRMTSGYGVWALLTASIALFFASFLAVQLSLTISPLLGAVVALTVWALFYVVMTSFQWAAATSLVGGILRTATGGLRGAWETTSRTLTRSDEAHAADIATRVTRAVKEELFRDVPMDSVRDEIRGYVNQLAPPRIKPEQMREEVQKLLEEADVDVHAIVTPSGEPYTEPGGVAVRSRRAFTPTEPRALTRGVDDALRAVKEEAFSGKDRVTAVADTALRLTGRSREEAETARARVEEWLRATGKEELDPEGIKRDLDRLLEEPTGGLAALRERARLIDRETVEAVLAQRSDITREEAHRIVETVERWVNAVVTGASSAKRDLTDAREHVGGKLKAYLESLDRPELDYEGIRNDLERLMEEPGAGADAIAARVKSIDRDTVKAILASRRDLTDEDAERIIEQVEAARDAVLRRLRIVRDEVERRMLAVRDATIHQAEEARKTAATAAWWGVATAVVSGIAAVIGGVVAVGV